MWALRFSAVEASTGARARGYRITMTSLSAEKLVAYEGMVVGLHRGVIAFPVERK